MENTQAAASASLFACINPSVLSKADLNKRISEALAMVTSMRTPAVSVRRAYYEGIATLFERIRKEGKGDLVEFEPKNLKSILLDTEESIEALRAKRAEAISVVKKTAPGLRLN